MSYSTLTDIQNYLPSEYVRQLSDDADTDEIDIEKVSDCIRRADDLIDGYMRGRYPVPIVGTVPTLISDISCKLAIYFLFKRSLIQKMPESIKSDYDEAMASLKEVQKGRISPFDVAENPVWFASNKNPPASVPQTNVITDNWNQYFV